MNHPNGDDRPQTFARDRLTSLVYGMAIAFGFGVAAMGPAMPLLRDDLGISRTVGGLHFTALAAGSVLAGFVVERIAGARGRRWVFWWGGAGAAAGALLIGAGWNSAITLLGALVLGTSGASMLAVSQATLSDHHPFHRSVALTEVNTAMSVGSALPALLVGALVALGAGWRPAFGAPATIWIVLVLARRNETFPPATRTTQPGQGRRLSGAYWFFWAALIPAVGAEWSIGAWGAGYLVDVAGTTEGSASFLMTAFFGAMVAGRLIGGRFARIVRAFPLLLASATVGLGGILVFWGSQSVIPVVCGLFIAGLGISMLFPMLLSLAMDTAPDLSDTAAARVSIAAGGSVVVAPLTLGALADGIGIRAAFGLVPGLFLLVVLLATLGCRTDTARQLCGSSPSP
jgi:fucose permease